MNTGKAELISIKFSTKATNAPLTEKQIKKNKKLKKKHRKIGISITFVDIILVIKKVDDIRTAEVIALANGHQFMVTKKEADTITIRSLSSYPKGITDMIIEKEFEYARLYVSAGESSNTPIA